VTPRSHIGKKVAHTEWVVCKKKLMCAKSYIGYLLVKLGFISNSRKTSN
jgi:hypothetical protein